MTPILDHDASSHRPEPPPIFSRERVLLVDDDPDFCRLVGGVLSGSGEARFALDRVERLDSALGVMRRGDADAVLLDLALPDSYGAFTIASACSAASEIPVLVLTSSEDERLVEAAERAGASRYLVKQRLDRRALPGAILTAIRERRVAASPLRASHCLQAFYERVEQAMAARSPGAAPAAVAVLEFDEFSVLRSLFGATLCEDLQRRACELLNRARPGAPQFTPIGDGSFALVLPGVRADAAAARVCADALASLSEVELSLAGGVDLSGITASVGVAMYPWDGRTPRQLVDIARLARREASRSGGGRYCFYHQGEVLR